jgi:hypothetical protein
MAVTPEQANQFLQSFNIPLGGTEAQSMAAINANPQAAEAWGKLVSTPQPQVLYAPNNPAQPSTSGVMPMGIEPLHQFEKTALTQMGSGQGAGDPAMQQVMSYLQNLMGNPAAAQAYISPEAKAMMQRTGQYYDKAATAYDAGQAPITGQDIMAKYNPYEEDVIKYAGEKAKAAILSNVGQRGAASFGDTATGVRMSELDRIPFEFRYKGYNDAATRAEQERQRNFQAGAGFSGLGSGATSAATGAQSIYGTGFNNALAIPNALTTAGANLTTAQNLATDRQLQAGGAVRGYNQTVNDIIQNELLQDQLYPRQNIAATQQLLGPYASTVQQSTQPSSAGQAAGWAGVASGLVKDVVGSFL